MKMTLNKHEILDVDPSLEYEELYQHDKNNRESAQRD